MKNFFCLSVLYIGLFSCRPPQKFPAKANYDTISVINCFFESNFFRRQVGKAHDIYLVRNQFIGSDSVFRTKYHIVKYLPNNSRSKMPNLGPGYPYDDRERLSFKLELVEDTAYVSMYNYGYNEFYGAILVKSNDIWHIVSGDVEAGGRIEYGDLLTEDWYLEMKKKVKPVKPLFPPNRKH